MKFRVRGKDINDKDRRFIVIADTEEECNDLIKAYIETTYIVKGITIATTINGNFKNFEVV